MPSRTQSQKSFLDKQKAEKYLENLPPVSERSLKEPYYMRQWWEDGYSYSLFTRYYLIQGGKRSIPEAFRLFTANNTEDFDPGEPLAKQIDPRFLQHNISSWIYYHANAKNPFDGSDLIGHIMTWEERASCFDLEQVMQNRNKLEVYRDGILQDELEDYQKLKRVVHGLIDLLIHRVDEFKTQPVKTAKDYNSLTTFAEKVINMRETIDKFARRGAALPERITEDRFKEVASEYEIDWVEPFGLPNANQTQSGDIIIYQERLDD